MIYLLGIEGDQLFFIDTDDLVGETFSKEEYIQYLINGGICDNLVASKTEFNLLKSGLVPFERVAITAPYGKSEKARAGGVVLNHGCFDMNRNGIAGNSETTHFYAKRHGNISAVYIWHMGFEYEIEVDVREASPNKYVKVNGLHCELDFPPVKDKTILFSFVHYFRKYDDGFIVSYTEDIYMMAKNNGVLEFHAGGVNTFQGRPCPRGKARRKMLELSKGV